MEEEKKVSDESIVEEAKGETPEETTMGEGTEAKAPKETKTKKKKKDVYKIHFLSLEECCFVF